MQVFKSVSAAILVATMAVLPAGAQPLTKVDGPKEPPPAGFTGNQYVDSAGCVFIRAGVGGQTTWVPRVSRDRKLVCGYEPTFPPGMLEAAAAVGSGQIPPAGTEASTGPAPAESAPAAAPTPGTPQALAAAPASSPAPATAAVPRASASAASAAKPRDLRVVRAGVIDRAATLCLPSVPAAQRYLLSDGRRVTQCAGKVPAEPVAWLNALGVPGLRVVPGAPSAAETERALRADRGAYRVVWQRGEIATTPTAARQAPAGQGGYVQVGVFAEPANAAATVARLKSLDLPVASSTGRKGGRAVKAIMAGPFASAAELQAALASVRRAGYRDAYIRG